VLLGAEISSQRGCKRRQDLFGGRMNCFACSGVFFDQRRLCCTPPLVRFQQLGMASHKVVSTDVMTYTPIYTHIQCIHISPCYIVLSSAAGVIGNIGLGLANQGTGHPTRHRRPAPAQSQSIHHRPSASAKLAPSLAWLPLRAVPKRAVVRTLDQALHHPPATR
jgi:hypothetical protein